MSLPSSQRLVALVVVTVAAAGAYQLTRPAHVAGLASAAPMAAQEVVLARGPAEPLRFEAPAAGPSATPSNPAYEACIDQPSFDGAVIECQLLLPRPAKSQRNR